MKTRNLLTLWFGVSLALIGGGRTAMAEMQTTQQAEVGAQDVKVNVPEAKFDEYKVVPQGAVIKSYQLNSSNDENSLEFKAQNVRQADQSYDFSMEHKNKLTIDASWNQMQHIWSHNAQTLYKEVKPGVFRLSTQLRTDMQNVSASKSSTTLIDFAQGSDPVSLGVLMQKGSIALGYAMSDALKIKFGASQELKQGHQAFGAGFGFTQEIELPKPVDYTVYNSSLGIDYGGKTAQMGIHYAMSSFHNNIDVLTWDNDKRVTDTGTAPAQGRMPLSPSNVAHNAGLNAGLNLPARTRATMDVSFGLMTQDQNLLPYSINTALTGAGFNPADPAKLPVNSANTKMETWAQNYALENNFFKPVHAGVKVTSYQLANKSEEINFPGYAYYDASWSTTPISTERFQFRKDAVVGHMDWQVINPVSLGVSYGEEKTKRDVREVRDDKENTLKVTSGYRVSRWLWARGSYVNAKRRMDDFEAEVGELAGMRRFDISDRDRNQGRLALQFSPGNVSFGLNGSLTHDKYLPGKGNLADPTIVTVTTDTLSQMYGVLQDRTAQGGADIGVDFDRVSLDGFVDLERHLVTQRSSENGTAVVKQDASMQWVMRTIDMYQTGGASAKVTAIKEKLDVRLGYDVSRSRSSYDIVDRGANASLQTRVNPPITKYTKQDISVGADIKARKDLTVSLGYLFEKFNVSDYAFNNIPLVSPVASGDLWLGDSKHDYKAHIVSVMAKYKW